MDLNIENIQDKQNDKVVKHMNIVGLESHMLVRYLSQYLGVHSYSPVTIGGDANNGFYFGEPSQRIPSN